MDRVRINELFALCLVVVVIILCFHSVPTANGDLLKFVLTAIVAFISGGALTAAAIYSKQLPAKGATPSPLAGENQEEETLS